MQSYEVLTEAVQSIGVKEGAYDRVDAQIQPEMPPVVSVSPEMEEYEYDDEQF